MKRWLALGAVAATVMGLAGCSAGGSTSTTSPGSGTTAPVASDLLVTVSTPSISGVQDSGLQTATVTVTAVDADRNVLAGVPVSIVPDNTSVASISGSVTNGSGIVTGTVGIGTDHSNRTIAVSVKSGSITKAIAFNVIGATLTATLAPAVIAPGHTGQIQYHLADANNVPIASAAITITGAFSSTATTDLSGNYTYSYTAPTTEQVLTVTATAAGTSAASTITDSSGTIPAAAGVVQSASLAADPTTVAINTAGSQANQANVRALFLGANNQPIPNIRVRFDLDGDVNGVGGTLNSGDSFVYSDENGVARTTYVAGTRSSGNQKLVIRACWSNNDFAVVSPAGAACPNNQSITSPITVKDSGVSLSIGTDNTITPVLAQSIYEIPFVVQVVDSVGNPQPNVLVSGSVDLPRYYRGQFVSSGSVWVEYAVPQSCDNEDVNRNGVKDVFSNNDIEDANGDGVLEPAAADVTIVPQTTGSNTTDAFGRAYFYLQYAQNKATWDDYTVTFTSIVSGSEGHKSFSGTLPAPAPLFLDTTKALPFAVSPYGKTIGSSVVTVTDPATGNSSQLCTKLPTL